MHATAHIPGDDRLPVWGHRPAIGSALSGKPPQLRPSDQIPDAQRVIACTMLVWPERVCKRA
jgi:hypothetical protein